MGPNPAWRTLIKGAVWTVPAVSLAAAAPAYASSSCVSTTYTLNWASSTWDYDPNTRTGTAIAEPSTSTPDTCNYIDAVYLDVPAAVVTKDPRIVGTGTPADPWRSSLAPTIDGGANQSAVANTSAGGNVQVMIPGTVEKFSLSFFNRETRRINGNAAGGQAIFLTNFTFRANTCAPTA